VPAATAARRSEAQRVNTDNLGFLLANASQRWNELLYERFVGRGFGEVRPAYGSILVPLFEEDGLRMGELAARARLSKQTMTTMVRLLERAGLVVRERDSTDGRAFRIHLTDRARQFQPEAEEVLAELDALVGEALGPDETTALEGALKGVIAL
jgi:MarR family transcriptional regulator, organic hydroperoxide resistance regulator